MVFQLEKPLLCEYGIHGSHFPNKKNNTCAHLNFADHVSSNKKCNDSDDTEFTEDTFRDRKTTMVLVCLSEPTFAMGKIMVMSMQSSQKPLFAREKSRLCLSDYRAGDS